MIIYSSSTTLPAPTYNVHSSFFSNPYFTKFMCKLFSFFLHVDNASRAEKVFGKCSKSSYKEVTQFAACGQYLYNVFVLYVNFPVYRVFHLYAYEKIYFSATPPPPLQHLTSIKILNFRVTTRHVAPYRIHTIYYCHI